MLFGGIAPGAFSGRPESSGLLGSVSGGVGGRDVCRVVASFGSGSPLPPRNCYSGSLGFVVRYRVVWSVWAGRVLY